MTKQLIQTNIFDLEINEHGNYCYYIKDCQAFCKILDENKKIFKKIKINKKL